MTPQQCEPGALPSLTLFDFDEYGVDKGALNPVQRFADVASARAAASAKVANEPGSRVYIAAQMGSGSRRYLVTGNHNEPEPAVFCHLMGECLRGGGKQPAAAYLITVDVAAKKRAPKSVTRKDMLKASRTALEEWLEDGIAQGIAPFDTDIVALEDVRSRVPKDENFRAPAPNMFGRKLKAAGAVYLDQIRLSGTSSNSRDNRASMYSIRNHDKYDPAKMSPRQIKAIYKEQYEHAVVTQQRSKMTA